MTRLSNFMREYRRLGYGKFLKYLNNSKFRNKKNTPELLKKFLQKSVCLHDKEDVSGRVDYACIVKSGIDEEKKECFSKRAIIAKIYAEKICGGSELHGLYSEPTETNINVANYVLDNNPSKLMDEDSEGDTPLEYAIQNLEQEESHKIYLLARSRYGKENINTDRINEVLDIKITSCRSRIHFAEANDVSAVEIQKELESYIKFQEVVNR